MSRWGMVIDLRKCVGCQTCTITCKQTNNLPPGVFWRRVADCETGSFPDVQRTFLPMGCMHCSQAPCQEVCPTTATYYRPDGTVDINYDLCVGCAYCIVACPYLARTIISAPEPYFDLGPTPAEAYQTDPGRVGVCTKCNFCLPRVEAGLAQGLVPGVDFDATPACVGSCIANALHFGDLDDPNSNVSTLIREHKTTRLLEELGTDPGIHYIVGENPPTDTLIPPQQQAVWHKPAVTNFVLGGAGAALYLLGLLLGLLQGGPPFGGLVLQLLGPALAGLGLLALTTEAGRPARGPYLFRHLGQSWMSREALAAALFIPAAALDAFFPHPLLRLLAAAAAAAFMVSQGFMVRRARGVTSWNVPLMPVLFVTNGLASGFGLLALLAAAGGLATAPGLLPAGGVIALTNLAVWLLYVRLPDPEFQRATQALRTPRSHALIVGAGHLLPLLLLLLTPTAPAVVATVLAALAGVLLLTGGVLQKAGIILEAGYLRPIALGRPTTAAPAPGR